MDKLKTDAQEAIVIYGGTILAGRLSGARPRLFTSKVKLLAKFVNFVEAVIPEGIAGPCPDFTCYILALALKLRKKAWKKPRQGSRKVPTSQTLPTFDS